ncbi:MAG: LppM family (lipo)protein [Halobacteriota archaeon]
MCALIALVLLAGCLDMTMEVTVEEEGTLDLDSEVIIDSMLASMIESELDGEGPDAIAEDFANDMEADGWNVVEYEGEETDDGDVRVTISARDTDPAELETISVDVEDDRITYVESEGFGDDLEDGFDDGELGDDYDVDDEILDSIQLRYVVNMPGDIVETNGEQTDDRTVEWTLADHAGTEEFEVTSEIADDAFPIPGFTPAIALVALVLVSLFALRARGR